MSGFDDLFKMFNSMEDGIDPAMGRAVTKACILVQKDAKILCPVDMGLLRQSIDRKIEKNQDGSVSGEVFTGLEYAWFVEFGSGLYAQDGNGKKEPWVYYDERREQFVTTKGQRPKLFMTTSMNRNQAEVDRLISGEVDKTAKDAMK